MTSEVELSADSCTYLRKLNTGKVSSVGESNTDAATAAIALSAIASSERTRLFYTFFSLYLKNIKQFLSSLN